MLYAALTHCNFLNRNFVQTYNSMTDSSAKLAEIKTIKTLKYEQS